MNAKTLEEAIANASLKLTERQTQILINELRDYLSHEVMRYQHKLVVDGFNKQEEAFAEHILLGFFKKVMNK